MPLNVTALMIYRLFGGFGPFHVGAIFSLVTVIAGIVPVALARRLLIEFWKSLKTGTPPAGALLKEC